MNVIQMFQEVLIDDGVAVVTTNIADDVQSREAIAFVTSSGIVSQQNQVWHRSGAGYYFRPRAKMGLYLSLADHIHVK